MTASTADQFNAIVPWLVLGAAALFIAHRRLPGTWDARRVPPGKLRYHGTGGVLFGLVIVNALLTLVTLGIYSFWAKNKVREFHYSHTEFDGDRFAYHGTGGELFAGALKAAGVMIVLGLLLTVATAAAGGDAAPPAAQFGIVGLFYVAIFLLMVVAVNGARRYRLSRSSWRGIRFSFHGRWQEFLAMMVRGALLSILTLGFYTPSFQNQRRKFFVSNARFGSEPFLYDGDGRPLFGKYVKALLLTMPTLGLCWIWYAAFKHRYFWNHTAMRGARFSSSISGGDLFRLHFTNTLLVLFTLGIGTPWAITRTHAFWCDNVALRGTVDWATIQQRAQTATATAEGLADGFEIDVGFGG
jgi:uncharacterized membrane protein YjgN (DUF898 family)